MNSENIPASNSNPIELVSDYTSLESPNVLRILKDEQGDLHISLHEYDESETGIRIAASGTRYSPRVRQAFYELIAALENEELPKIE